MEEITINKIIAAALGWLIVCTVITKFNATPVVSATIGMFYIPVFTYVYAFIKELVE